MTLTPMMSPRTRLLRQEASAINCLIGPAGRLNLTLCIADWLSALLREHETFESRPRLCHRCGAAKWIIADALEGDLAISGLATFGYREGWQRIVSCGLDDLVGR